MVDAPSSTNPEEVSPGHASMLADPFLNAYAGSKSASAPNPIANDDLEEGADSPKKALLKKAQSTMGSFAKTMGY